MKRIFFKVGLFLALGLTTTAFYSCNNDDDNSGISDNGGNGGNGSNSGNASTITATDVINGSAQITTVKALADWVSGDDKGYDEIAQAPYENNGFTLELTAPLADRCLEPVDADFNMTGITISDKNAKTYLLDDGINGYDKDGNFIGIFYLEEENDYAVYYTYWMYADRDVTVKGEYKEDYKDTEKYDLNLKKGWNVVYESNSFSAGAETGTETGFTFTLTSQKPSGVNYSWNFYGGYGFSSTGVAAKSVENIKSVFSKLQEDRKNGIRQRQEK